MKNSRQHFCSLHSVFSVIAPAGYDSRKVVIIPEKAVPSAAVKLFLPFFQAFLQLHKRQGTEIPFFFSRFLIQHHMLKLEHHGKLASVRLTVKLCPVNICSPGLSNCDQISFLEGFSA